MPAASQSSKKSSHSASQSVSSNQRSAHSSGKSANAFVSDIHGRVSRAEQEELDRQRAIVPRLAARAYHLEEGNSWCQDWIQYQQNTHPIFGFCFAHSLHPVKRPQRVIILLGSIAFGLTITNVVFLGLLNNAQAGKFVNTVYNITGQVVDTQYRYTKVELDDSMVFLWTVGSFLHSCFDILIWYLAACACFRPGGLAGRNSTFCQNFGLYTAVLLVVGMVFCATFVVVSRLNEDNEKWTQFMPWLEGDDDKTILPNSTNIDSVTEAETFVENIDSTDPVSNSTNFFDDLLNATGINIPSLNLGDYIYTKEDTKYAFLIGYAIELTIALFVYYPFTSTVFFSGILGCGKIPILGGRPYELRKEVKKNASTKRTPNESGDSLESHNYV